MLSFFRVQPLSPSRLGEGDPSAAVVFVHGLGGSYWTWNAFSTHLKQQWRSNDPYGLEYDEYYVNQGLIHKLPLINFFQKLYKILRGPDINKLSLHLRTVIDEVCKLFDLFFGHSADYCMTNLLRKK